MEARAEVPLLVDTTCSDTLWSRHALGVLAAEEMLDKSDALPSGCSEASLLPSLLLRWEGAESSDSEEDLESDENSRESVRPASAMRRRRRSAVPSLQSMHLYMRW